MPSGFRFRSTARLVLWYQGALRGVCVRGNTPVGLSSVLISPSTDSKYLYIYLSICLSIIYHLFLELGLRSNYDG